MADTVYTVRVRYELDSRGAESAAGNLARTFDRFAAAAAGAFTAHKLIDFGRRLVQMQGQFESMRVSLASLLVGFSAPGFSKGAQDFERAMTVSKGLMDQIYLASAKLPGTAEDLVLAMRAAMPGGLEAGKAVLGRGSIESMAEKIVMGSWLLGIPGGVNTAAREFQSMMEGRATRRLDLFARLSALMGEKGPMDPKTFNQMSQPERWAAVERALDKLVGPGAKSYSDTWRAVSTTTFNWAQQILRVATGGVFDTIKKHLHDLNDWIQKNRESIFQAARAFSDWLSPKVSDALDRLRDAFAYIYEHRSALVEVAKAFSVMVAGDRLLAFANQVGKGRGGAAGFKNDFRAAFGGALAGYGVSSLTGGDTFTNLLATLLGGLATFGGAIGLVAAALLGLVAAVNVASDAIDASHKDAIDNSVESRRLMGLYKNYEMNVGAGSDPLRDGSPIYTVGAQIIREKGLLGGKLQTSRGWVDVARDQINQQKVSEYLAMTNLDESGLKAARYYLTQVAGKMKGDPNYASYFGPREGTAEEKLQALLYDRDKGRGATPRKADVNVTVNIRQDISQAEDPDRILVRTKQAIEDALIRPIESGHNRFSVLR